MKQVTVLIIVYVVIIITIAIFLLKFTNRGYSRRVLSDIAPCPFGKEKYFVSQRINDRSGREGIVSFSLYGKYSKYAPTLYKQLDVIPKYLPTWQSVVHLPSDVPDTVVTEITSRGAAVVILNGGETEGDAIAPGAPKIGIKGHEGALWRFLPAMDIVPFITLDADDSFDTTMPKKIEDWLTSGRQFFIFKPLEIFLPMAAGRWGARGGVIKGETTILPPVPDMLDRINNYCEHWFGFDEAFLKKEIWPIVNKAGVYRSAYWPVTEILCFAMIASFVAAIATLLTAKSVDQVVANCRRK